MADAVAHGEAGGVFAMDVSRMARSSEDWRRLVVLPDRFPDGRYSVAGAAKRFGVTLDMVRAGIKRGLVKGERHDFEAHRGAWWLEIPEDTAARLERLAAALKRV